MLKQIPLWFKELKSNLNWTFFCAINIENYIDIFDFKERLNWIVKEIKASPLAEGLKGVLLPGEVEWKTGINRKKEGIPISSEVWKDLKQLSNKYQEPLET